MTEAILIGTALLTATLSGVLGMGGGITLITVMAIYLPPPVLIPLHGIVQLSSNLSRSILHFRHIRATILAPFAAGGLVGAALGSRLVVEIPEDLYKTVLAVFILVFTWMPKLKGVRPIPGRFAILGAVATFISLFVGATGPLIAPFFVREKGLDKRGIMACKASCQLVVHTLKIITFFALGFSVGPYLGLLIGMVLVSFLGNYLGSLILGKLPENVFRWFFKILITVLAVRMLTIVHLL